MTIPSIGIGQVASLGKVIRLRADIGKYAFSPTIPVIQFESNNDLNFLYSTMNTSEFQKQFKSSSNGSTRQSVGIQDLRELQLLLPQAVTEQKKLGQFFKNMDLAVTLHQNKLDQFKSLKFAFLKKCSYKKSITS